MGDSGPDSPGPTAAMNGLAIYDDEPEWRKLKLTLERPHTDDQGNPIRQLLDVTPDGQQIYEPSASMLCFSMATRLRHLPGPRTPISSLQRTSAGCLLKEATTFLRRGMPRTGGSTPRTPMDSTMGTKKPTLRPRARPPSL